VHNYLFEAYLAERLKMEPQFQNKALNFYAGTSAAFLMILFGTNAVAIKITLLGMGAMTCAGLRFALGATVLFLWTTLNRKPLILNRIQIVPVMISTLFFTMQVTLVYLGLSRTEAGRGTLLINTQPLFVLVLAHYFIPGDGMTVKKLFGMIFGFSGVATLLTGQGGVSANIQSGDLMLMGSSIIWAGNSVYTKHILNRITALQLVFFNMLIAAPLFIAAGVLFDHQMIYRMDTPVCLALLYQGAITASFGYVAWTGMLRHYGATTLNSFVFIMPVSGVVMSALILGEAVSFRIFLSLGLICLSIVCNGYWGKRAV